MIVRLFSTRESRFSFGLSYVARRRRAKQKCHIPFVPTNTHQRSITLVNIVCEIRMRLDVIWCASMRGQVTHLFLGFISEGLSVLGRHLISSSFSLLHLRSVRLDNSFA